MRWNEIKKNLDNLLTTFKQAIPDLKELKATQKELVSSLNTPALKIFPSLLSSVKMNSLTTPSLSRTCLPVSKKLFPKTKSQILC